MASPSSSSSPDYGQDIQRLQQSVNSHDVQLAKMDTIISMMTNQIKAFEQAINQFQVAIVTLQKEDSFQGKLLNFGGAILLLIIGALIGKYLP